MKDSQQPTPPRNVPGNPGGGADRTLHIKPPWSMTLLEDVDEMLAYLESRTGPGHPLHGRKLYVSAVNNEADAWYVEGEAEDFYAIVYFGEKKRYGTRMMPKCEILKDWNAVLRRFATDHEAAMREVRATYGQWSAEMGEDAATIPGVGGG